MGMNTTVPTKNENRSRWKSTVQYTNQLGRHTVPQHYYLTKNIDKFAKKEGVKRVLIPRQSKFDVQIEITELDSIIEWEYEVKRHDIGFQVILEESNDNETEITDLIPMHKFETELEPLKGMLRCKKLGI
ncbi:GOLD domain-containing protein, partial [Caerostris extrusa]